MSLSNDGTAELILAKVTSRDAGLYTLSCSNEVGNAETFARVSVVGSEVSSVDQKSPRVIVNPPDIDVP